MVYVCIGGDGFTKKMLNARNTLKQTQKMNTLNAKDAKQDYEAQIEVTATPITTTPLWCNCHSHHHYPIVM